MTLEERIQELREKMKAINVDGYHLTILEPFEKMKHIPGVKLTENGRMFVGLFEGANCIFVQSEECFEVETIIKKI